MKLGSIIVLIVVAYNLQYGVHMSRCNEGSAHYLNRTTIREFRISPMLLGVATRYCG